MQASATRPALAIAALPAVQGWMRVGYLVALAFGGSAFVALSAQFAIYLPFTPVPITGSTFGVFTVGALLGSRLGAASLVLYMLEGSAGLLWGSQGDGFKVFAPGPPSGGNGWEAITGATGGYIIGFIFAAFVVGWLVEKGFDRNPWSLALAMAAGNLIIYVPGLFWLDHLFPGKALEFGLYPFVAGDAAKLLLAASLVPLARSAVARPAGRQTGLPQRGGGLVLGRYLPLPPLYALLAAVMMLGALLPWGLPGGGDDAGFNLQAGRIALAVGAASLVAIAEPRLALLLLVVTVTVLGILLPFGALPDAYKLNVEQEGGLAALALGLLALVVLSLFALPRLTRREALGVAQFILGTLAGFAAFYHIVQVLTATDDFALTDLRAGLLMAAFASVLLAFTAISEGTETSSVD